MSKHEYKKGDRVRHEKYGDGTAKFVDYSAAPPLAIEFDKTHEDLHDCEWKFVRHTKDGHGAWCYDRELTPIQSTRKRDAKGRFVGKKNAPAKKAAPSIAKRLEALEKQVALNTSAIDVLKQMEKDNPQGLYPGDCTHDSKEVADALTAMGYQWWMDNFNTNAPSIAWGGHGKWSHLDGLMFKTFGTAGLRHLTPSEFLRRAEVTAKELGLTPKKVEPWKPKVGDWVVVKRNGLVAPVFALFDLNNFGHEPYARLTVAVGTVDEYLRDLRPATPEEIAETTKYIPQFGDVVKAHGHEWKVVSECADSSGDWLIYKNTDSGWNHDFAKTSDLTLIRRPQ